MNDVCRLTSIHNKHTHKKAGLQVRQILLTIRHLYRHWAHCYLKQYITYFLTQQCKNTFRKVTTLLAVIAIINNPPPQKGKEVKKTNKTKHNTALNLLQGSTYSMFHG